MEGKGILGIVRKHRLLWMAILDFLLFFVLFLHRALLPQESTYTMESVSEVRFGQDGNTLVIDNGKKTLLLLDSGGRICQRYDGGSEDAPFFYACHMAQKPDGSIYVADIEYGKRGNLLDRERILRLSDGKSEVVYDIDYADAEDAETPLQYGEILELQEYGGFIYFVREMGGEAVVFRLDDQDNALELGRVQLSGDLNDASYDVSLGKLVLSYRTGRVVETALGYSAAEDSASDHSLMGESALERSAIEASAIGDREPVEGDSVLLDASSVEEIRNDRGQIAWDLAARGGELFYTEVIGKSIWHDSIGQGGEAAACYGSDSILFKLDVSSDGRRVLATDYVAYYEMDYEMGRLQERAYVTEAPVAYFSWVLLLRALLALAAALALYLLFCLLRFAVRRMSGSEQALRVICIVAASFTVAFILSNSLLKQILDTSMRASEKEVGLFAEMLRTEIDISKLRNIARPGDYQDAEYTAVKEALDAHVWDAYAEGDYYYYIIYRGGGGMISAIMDFEESAPCWNPVYIYGEEPYTGVLADGEEVTYSENSAYGAWTFILLPIRDASGEILAELEVGQSLDAINARQRQLIQELLANVIIGTLVLTMLLLELFFLFGFVEKRREAADLDPTELVPARTLIFFSYMADSMQDAFIAVLLSSLYKGGLPVSDGVAAALPISLQLLAMAVFSVLGGKLAGRYGIKRVLAAGFLAELGGFLLCFLTGSYMGVLAGKVWIGTGMGLIYVSCNTVASMGKDTKHTEEAFAGVSAGVLSGITIGAGMASLLLGMGGYRLVYLFGTLLLSFGLLVVFGVVPRSIQEAKAAEAERPSGQVSTFRFLAGRRVLGFFLFLLIPFMMALSFREFFFPLYVTEHGVTEVQIARIYLLCGLLVLYIGPRISAWLIHKYGPTVSVTLASLLLILDMGLFLLFPYMQTVFLCVVLLSFIVSFAYTCQYTYFDSLGEIEAYGNGAAMGIYSMVESLGQTLGPIVYGSLLSLGYRRGILAFAAAMGCALLLFLLLRRRRG